MSPSEVVAQAPVASVPAATDSAAQAPVAPASAAPGFADPAFVDKLTAARSASAVLATATADAKNTALRAIARALVAAEPRIVAANARDLEAAVEAGLSESLRDRLRLDGDRLRALAAATELVATLVDPIGETVRGRVLPNGLRLDQVRVPFGVVGAIYEARPNVTVDIAALALKSGNAAVLRAAARRCTRTRPSSRSCRRRWSRRASPPTRSSPSTSSDATAPAG